MAIVTGSEALKEIGTWVAEQMGLEPNDVKGIDLGFNCDALVTAKVTVVWTEPLLEGLKEHLSRFKLVPLTAVVEGDKEGPLRRLVEAAEAVTSNAPGEPGQLWNLRQAAQRMREVVPKEEGD